MFWHFTRDNNHLVKSEYHILMILCALSRMLIHCRCTELLERIQCGHKYNHYSTTFNSLNRPGKNIWLHRLQILQDYYSIGLYKNFVASMIVAPTNIRWFCKHIEAIVNANILSSSLALFELPPSLVAMWAEAQLLLVAPEYGRSGIDLGFVRIC